MNSYYKGNLISGPRGPAGPDGNPIGTVISFMGLTAPQDYLICNGAACNISDYPDLAAFFAEQFGAVNHFGGDGETTFAVPDLRNLFLRGYHGEAEEQLSGDIGTKQAATEHVNIHTLQAEYLQGPPGMAAENTDAGTYIAGRTYVHESGHDDSVYPAASTYTARPVNMAVLYCIKAMPSEPVLAEYDTEDGWHVRKWSDGYVEMFTRFLWTVSFSSTTGGLLRAGSSALTYPLQLTELYTLNAYAGSGCSSGAVWISTGWNAMSDRLVKTPKFYAVATDGGKTGFEVYVTATGRWK